MCGIAGEVFFHGKPATPDAVQAMTGVLHRRGPDGHGIYLQDNVALGHRRLKIIDLSNASNQPMVDSALGLSIVYNGAIYNYPELRRELQQKGYTFFSAGDTEVILKAYHAWGMDFVQRLNGMFAFAIWERESGRILLARDRIGIKPLYCAPGNDSLRFASTLPALLKAGNVDTAIDPVGLHHYMTFHAVVPPPFTIIKGVRKLAPGHLMLIEPDGSQTVSRYWDLTYGPQDEDAGRSDADWRALVLDTLRQSVERRLVADVPVGVLLSGGLDSSLIVGLLAEAGHEHLSSFSIGFEDAGGEEGNEFQYSDIVADRFETDHHKIVADREQLLGNLIPCIEAMSEPMVSHDCIGFYLLSREVAKHLKVVMSGQGADEVFAGYHWYPPMMASNRPVEDYARVFFDRGHEEFTRTVNPDYVAEDFSRQFIEEHFGKPGADLPIDKALRTDTTVMLVDDPVKRVDNMTMAWGLEARVPFLDHELLELAARVPPELKVRDEGKFILKEAARQVIPAEVIDRPKGYFPVPALKYLEGPYLEMVKDALNSAAAKERGVFNRDMVETFLDDPGAHLTPLRGSKLWQVALVEMWLQSHNI